MNNGIALSGSVLLIIILSIISFLSGIDSTILGFSADKFINGELWRIITFPFSHVNSNHLIENMATLIFVAILSFEFKLTWKRFLLSFFISGIAIAILNIFMAPEIIIAGASLGTYAVLGTLGMKGHDFISHYILLFLFGSSIFLMNIIDFIFPGVVTLISIKSSIYHFAGFISGIVLFYVFMKKKTNILDFDEKKL